MLSFKELKEKAIKEQLLTLGRKCVNHETNRFDGGTFKKKFPKQYTYIANYFGSITLFKQALGCDTTPLSLIKHKSKKYKLRDSVRNNLALNMLNSLLETKTYEQIAEEYGVSKQAIHDLHMRLSATEE